MKINVLGLFDGISCGQLALQETGIQVGAYYASEINTPSIQITRKHFGDTIHLGDINNWKDWDIDFRTINLILAGSPCKSFSRVAAMHWDNQSGLEVGQSTLIWKFFEILEHARKFNPGVRFLLENVSSMKAEDRNAISRILKIPPERFNSSKVSAQLRDRLYWHDLGKIPPLPDKNVGIRDVIKGQCYVRNKGIVKPRKDKATCLDANYWKGPDNRGARTFKLLKGKPVKLSPEECEILQTFPVGYTSHGITEAGKEVKISPSARYQVLGDSWTLEVIKHIFSNSVLLDQK